MLDVQDFDLIHFFWRADLFNLLSSWTRQYFIDKGWDYHGFVTNVIAKANITTSVYDHLFLSDNEIQERKVLFNALSIGYTTVSQRLSKLYSSVETYPKPYGAIEDGVDLDFFTPSNLERLADEQREIVVGWVGNSKWGGDGIDHKGIETIIKPVVESLRAEGCKVRGFYADRQERWIPHSEMNDYYNSIDIYLCASDIEGTPNPALESMACGLPIITTDVGMIPQLFGPLQKEYILANRSKEDLKEKLKELIESPQKRMALSKENLERIQSWSWTDQSRKWDEFFKEMLIDSQPGHNKERRDYLRKQIIESHLASNLAEVAESKINEMIENGQHQELLELSNQLQLKISLMEQSAFWKVRNEWFKFKKKFGFAKHKY
jgi:glycosyltransferase involved in cell wall biosynthesis